MTYLTDREYDLMLDKIETLKADAQTLQFENHNLKSLCVRAADALDDWHAGLKAELRKAAQ